MTRFIARCCNSEEVITLTSVFFPFQDGKPLQKIGGHMFSEILIRNWRSIIINSIRLVVYKYSCCNNIFLIESKGKPRLWTSQECFIVFLTIMRKTITVRRISKKIHPYLDILWTWFYPRNPYTSFFCKPYIVTSFFMHLWQNTALILSYVKYTSIGFKKVFIRKLHSFMNSRDMDRVLILHLPKKSIVLFCQSRSLLKKYAIRKWWVHSERKRSNLS